jgi:eukaryotic-like serine/threonine-protein kinase
MEPTRLGPYAIRRRIGRGGMGTVYEAVDAAGRPVAVKTLSAYLGDEAGLRRRFEAEIETLKGLRHPGIVRLIAFGEDEGVPFFAMELVPGRSLEETLKAGRTFSWQETVTVAAEIARALKAAHDQGIVHRDLKPANLLLPDEPGGGVKLADFGIARLFGDTGQTLAGTVVGTAEYMAPEQAAGGPVDHRVDLYALGLVMYAMLVGRPPFRGGEVGEVLRRQQRETPARVSAFVTDVPATLDRLIGKLLAKDPADRPATALALGRLLAAIEQDPRPPNAADPVATADPAAATVDFRGGNTLLGREPPPEVPPGVDLLAATRATVAGAAPHPATHGPAAMAADARGQAATLPFVNPTAADGPASLAHRPTEPAPGLRKPQFPADTRFTTVEELDRSQQDQAARQRRREGLTRFGLAGGLVALVVAVGYVVSQPVSRDTLHQRIMEVADDPGADLRDATDLIDLFLARHGDDPRAVTIRSLRRMLDLDALEREARRRPRTSGPLGPLERDYRAAVAREQESPVACLAGLEAILTVYGAGPPTGDEGDERSTAADASLWLDLTRRQIDRVRPLAAREREEDATRAAATLGEAASLATRAETTADQAAREALLARRRELLSGLVEIFGDRPHVADAVTEARRLLAAP